VTETNRAECERIGWNENVARCDLLLGELDVAVNDHAAAEPRIANALRIFRNARQGQDIPYALLAGGRLSLSDSAVSRGSEDGNPFAGHESALSHCEEALRLAARSGFLLMKCDALNFRAQLLRSAARPTEALADANEARDIAERCSYYWGHHEAIRQLCDTHRRLGHAAEARQWEEAERALTRRMAPEIAAALGIHRQHEAEMKRLYDRRKD
jgi:tetratricopeptide (TPR) repeat protein